MRFDEDFGFLTVHFRYPDHSRLKIDFNQYSRKKLQKGVIWRGLEIDSFVDIAVNKLSTISISPRGRDYIDFYLIEIKRKFAIDTLLRQTKKKFGEEIDSIQLAKNFLKVSEYTDFPKMLIPLDEANMLRFYERCAGGLRSRILK